MTTTKMTLGDFSADTVWFTSVGIPAGIEVSLTETEDPDTGEMVPIDFFDWQNALPFDSDLEGTVNEHGEWCWDGEGNPSDWNRNTVQAIKAFKAS